MRGRLRQIRWRLPPLFFCCDKFNVIEVSLQLPAAPKLTSASFQIVFLIQNSVATHSNHQPSVHTFAFHPSHVLCSVPEEGPLQAEQLMDACLLDNPADRPTMKEVIERLLLFVRT